MKRPIQKVILAVVFAGIYSTVIAAGGDAGPTNTLDTASIRRTADTARVLLQPTSIMVQDGPVYRNVSVSLVEERYITETDQKPRSFYKYHLASATNGTTLSREIWSQRGLGGFYLISAAPARNYLVWLDGPFLCYSEISTAGAKTVTQIAEGTTSCTQADGVINLGLFEGADQFWGTKANNCELQILSVALGASGEIVMTAKNIFGHKFRFTNAGGQWRAFGDSGELRRR